MSASEQYTPYHPKWYRRHVSVWWWLENWSYAKFVLRELTSLFVAFFALIYLWQLRAIVTGPEAYAEFLDRMKTPFFLFLHVITLLFVLFHSITWFNLAPKAMAVRMGGKRVPDLVISGMNYVIWLIASVAVAWIMLRG